MIHLWALHIPDQVLEPSWWVLGWFGTILWVFLASRGIEDEEIPRIGLFSAVFFLGTLFHLPFFGVHLLLPGVMGLFLGNRAILAILVAMLLQAGMGHGGFSTAGINTLVMGTPACLSWWLILPLIKHLQNRPSTLACVGFCLGFFPVCLAVILHAMALYWGGVVSLTYPIIASFPLHLPVAVAEGLFLASALPFLAAAGIPPFAPKEISPSESTDQSPDGSLTLGLVFLCGLILPSEVIQAAVPLHNLRIEWKIMSGNRLEVEAYFERGASFQKGELIIKDEKGTVILRETKHESSRFVVTLPSVSGPLDLYVQADDHVAHAAIPAKALGVSEKNQTESAGQQSSVAELSRSESAKAMDWRDLALGLCLILSVSAFWMSWRAMGKSKTLPPRISQ